MPQCPVRAPLLCKLHGSAVQIALKLLQLDLQPGKQGECVRGCSGKAHENAVIIDPAYLPGFLLEDRVAERYLVAAERQQPLRLGGDLRGVDAGGADLIVNGKKIRLTAVKDPAELKWNEVGADIVIPGDDAELASTLPGAMGGDLGDPIKPLPPLRLLVIPPIVVAPILEAPPVSTLAPTVSTIPTVGEIPRDPSDPGKPGGVRQ